MNFIRNHKSAIIAFLIVFQLIGIAFIAYAYREAIHWKGGENYASLAVLLFGPPLVFIQIGMLAAVWRLCINSENEKTLYVTTASLLMMLGTAIMTVVEWFSVST